MKNFKWDCESFDCAPIYVVLFVSRNKDNIDIPDFKERRESFITHESSWSEHILNKFRNFINNGVDGELSRMYYSVNERDPDAVYKSLLHFLIDTPNFNLCAIMPKLAGIAAKKENALTKHWMFDFDSEDFDEVTKFCNDIIAIDPKVEFELYKTPHGHAIITNRGFDTRELFNKWSNDIVTLKRDDLLCVAWDTKKN